MKFHLNQKILLIVAAALIVAGTAAFFVFRKEANDKLLDTASEKNSEVSAPESQNFPENNPIDESSSDEEVEDKGDLSITEDEDLDPNRLQESGENMFAHITTEHCNRGCEAFSNKADYLEYCKQVCGITAIKNVSNCDGRVGLSKDYCLKDLGVTKKDASICNQITDENVKKTCKSRILEDILEEQHGGG